MSTFPAKVSVIIPIYNVEKYLSACLESCVSQTLKDIEIICVNDGTKDNSQRIVDAFAQRDRRIISIVKENGGLSSARNAGLAVATGKTIMFLDSDDYLAPKACERIWLETLEAPTDIIVFGTSIFPDKPTANNWMYETLTKIRTHRFWKFEPAVLFSERGAKPFVWRQAFSKKFLDDHKLTFDETIKFGEDTVFQMEAFPHGTNFAFIEDRLYFYRWFREGSLMAVANADLDSKVGKHIFMLEKITEYWSQQKWFDSYGDWYLDWLLDFVMPDIQHLPGKKAEKHLISLSRLLNKYKLEDYWQDEPSPTREAYVDVIHNVGEKRTGTGENGRKALEKASLNEALDPITKK